MTSGRRHDDRSDRSFEQELERYSRERSYHRDESFSRNSDRDGSRERRSKDDRETVKAGKPTRYVCHESRVNCKVVQKNQVVYSNMILIMLFL